jgi:Ser-tRNA(Ala) deacylase AlaX
MSWGVPLANWLPVDRLATGTPLPYGIDITPDGKVWFARLHTGEIGPVVVQKIENKGKQNRRIVIAPA